MINIEKTKFDIFRKKLKIIPNLDKILFYLFLETFNLLFKPEKSKFQKSLKNNKKIKISKNGIKFIKSFQIYQTNLNNQTRGRYQRHSLKS